MVVEEVKQGDILTRSLSKFSLGGKQSREVLPSYEAVADPEVVVREVPSSFAQSDRIQPVLRKDGK